MTTASTASVLDHTSDAAFRAWVAEIILQLVTTCGLTQTADTGQINTTTVTRPGTNTAGGYSIFRFNDTLQATSPVFIKLEYGTGAVATAPQMWITVGTGSNGSGTLTGTTTVRGVVAYGSSAPVSTVTSYTSRYVYNATYGYLGMVFKIGSTSNTNVAYAGFVLFRSNDTTGAASGDSVNLITNSNTTTGGSAASNSGFMQCLSYTASLIYPPTPGNGAYWAGGVGNAVASANNLMPFALTSTTTGGNSYVVPVYYMTPIICVSAYNCIALIAEAPLNTTFSATLVGAASITFLSVAYPFGAPGVSSATASNNTFCMLWQ